MQTFNVHYGNGLKAMTAIAAVLLIGVSVAGIGRYQEGALAPLLMIVLPLGLLLVTALFAVLRYELDDAGLHVVRPIGRLCIARTVTSVIEDDAALWSASRTLGNGGLFAFSGWYKLPKYGRCRLWVTDMRHAVVIHGDRGCIVVSPLHGDAFVAAIKTRFGVTA